MQRPLDVQRTVFMATRGRHKEQAIPSLEVWPSATGASVRSWETAFREASPAWLHTVRQRHLHEQHPKNN